MTENMVPLATVENGVDSELLTLAKRDLIDVFTPAGDAGCIVKLFTFTQPGHRFYGKGQCAFVEGINIPNGGDWFPLTELEVGARETVKIGRVPIIDGKPGVLCAAGFVDHTSGETYPHRHVEGRHAGDEFHVYLDGVKSPAVFRTPDGMYRFMYAMGYVRKQEYGPIGD